jgi:hypothetical protein
MNFQQSPKHTQKIPISKDDRDMMAMWCRDRKKMSLGRSSVVSTGTQEDFR